MARHRLDPGEDRAQAWSVAITWSPMLVGVVIMLGYVIYAIALRADHGSLPVGPDFADVPAPSVAATTPPASEDAPSPIIVRNARAAAPELSPLPESPGPTTPPSAPAPPPSQQPPPPAPPPPPSALTGRYGIDGSWPDVFIGKVTIVNTSRRSHDWTVELAFPDNVGKLNTYWVDGTAQPTLRRSGTTYVFTSTVAVPAGSSVVLKFHFDRTGRDVDPTTCTVNANPCTY